MNADFEVTVREVDFSDLENYRPLILPKIYEELSEAKNGDSDLAEQGYICLAAYVNGANDGNDAADEPRSVLIADTEDNGNLNLLSVWTKQKDRRKGLASFLFQKMTEVARALFQWGEAEYGEDILVSTMYALRDRYRMPFEAWLRANDFTDFYIIKEDDEDTPAIRAASAEAHFFRYGTASDVSA